MAVLGSGAAYVTGSIAPAPARASVGLPPADLSAAVVSFASTPGNPLSGWFIPGRPGVGSVLLMHGVRANRPEMLGRARFLSRHGFAVLLFDFQARGESPGRSISILEFLGPRLRRSAE
jgi:uncharacterized protein